MYVRRRWCASTGWRGCGTYIRKVLGDGVCGDVLRGVYQLQPPRLSSVQACPLSNHGCSVATCTAFPRPRQPVLAPASCDTSLGISESVLQMKFGSVNGIRSSLRGRAWSERGVRAREGGRGFRKKTGVGIRKEAFYIPA
jgi:hypothetical protein